MTQLSSKRRQLDVPHRGTARLCLLVSVLAPAWATLSGCAASARIRGAAASRADRLKAHYADLESGRFAVIADFEQSEHMELFRVVSPNGQGAAQWSLTGGIAETGSRCIRFTLSDPDDALLANNDHVANWFLKRDWREYDLLIMQIHSSRPDVEVELALVGGSGRFRSTVHSLLPLRKGWNPVRLDLAEVGDHLPLDDVQELRWSVAAAGPVRLALDDLVLTNNTRDLYGSAEEGAQGLFIRRRGRRWGIGVPGRFELGFAGGQIVHWYDLSGDPNRLNNLLEGAVMGPSPIVLPAQSESDSGPDRLVGDFDALGETVVVRQQVVEASPVRIVLVSEWRFGRHGEASASDAPFQRWSYAVYPTGTVYTRVECTTEVDEWRPEEIGLAVSRADRGGIEHYEHEPARLEDPERLRHVTFAYTRSRRYEAPGLLFALHDARRAPVLEFFRDEPNHRVTVVASGGAVRRESDAWTAMLCLWPADNCAGTKPVERTLDYCYPADRIRVDVGALVTDDEGDENHDGYNERLGCYVLAPEGSQLRFRLDGREQPSFYPAFVTKNTANRQAWVYVDFIVLEPVGRDANGDVVFQIPKVIDGLVTVEVYLRGAPTKLSADSR